jgi:hypothetical protein
MSCVLADPAPTAAADAHWDGLPGDRYALDGLERDVVSPRRSCDPSAMVAYRGTTLRYAAPVTVHGAFRERLERFEAVALEVATRVYGRAPQRIRHAGGYSCRNSTGRHRERLSEHALGNAIDLVGFDFGPAKKTDVLPPGLPKQLRYGFQVRVQKHWGSNSSPSTALHARFLRELTGELRARRDIFRGFIGPADPKHERQRRSDETPVRYLGGCGWASGFERRSGD